MAGAMPTAFVFDSIGIGEWLVLLALVLIVYGPRRMPEMARKLGRLLARAQRAADLFRLQLMSLERDAELTEEPDSQAAAAERTADLPPPGDKAP